MYSELFHKEVPSEKPGLCEGLAWKKSRHWNRKWLSLWGLEPSKVSRIRAFNWWGFGADLLLKFSDNCQRASASWLLMGLRSATGGVWNAGVETGIGASTQSGSSSIWGIMVGSIPWNSEGSTGGGDERGRTRVWGVPDWRRLDLLGRPEVKWLIVQSARGMELLPEEGAADWRDIRIKTRQEPVWVCKFCQEWNSGGRRYKVIVRNPTPFQSNIQCQRGMYLVMIERRLWQTIKDVGAENDLLNDLSFNLYVAPWSPVVRLVVYFGVVEVVKTEVLRSRVKEPEWTK